MKTRLLAVIVPAILLALGILISITSLEANPTLSGFSEEDLEASEACVDCHEKPTQCWVSF